LQARKELGDWLERHPEHELRAEVANDLDDSLRRLAESDLSIAAFYDRVGNAFGVRFHAERAREEAAEARDGERVARAEALLASLPVGEAEGRPDDEPGPSRIDDHGVFEP
jgi:outer membrane protein assembly factor BamD (BamD/ComL family)